MAKVKFCCFKFHIVDNAQVVEDIIDQKDKK